MRLYVSAWQGLEELEELCPYTIGSIANKMFDSWNDNCGWLGHRCTLRVGGDGRGEVSEGFALLSVGVVSEQREMVLELSLTRRYYSSKRLLRKHDSCRLKSI